MTTFRCKTRSTLTHFIFIVFKRTLQSFMTSLLAEYLHKNIEDMSELMASYEYMDTDFKSISYPSTKSIRSINVVIKVVLDL